MDNQTIAQYPKTFEEGEYNTIYIALDKGGDDVISKLTRYWTKGKYVHAEFVFSDGVWFAPSMPHPLADFHNGYKGFEEYLERYDFISIKVPKESEDKARQFAKFYLKGSRFDFLGFLMTQMANIGINSTSRYFCSEAVTKLMQVCHVFPMLDEQAHKVAPADIYTILKPYLEMYPNIFKFYEYKDIKGEL